MFWCIITAVVSVVLPTLFVNASFDVLTPQGIATEYNLFVNIDLPPAGFNVSIAANIKNEAVVTIKFVVKNHTRFLALNAEEIDVTWSNLYSLNGQQGIVPMTVIIVSNNRLYFYLPDQHFFEVGDIVELKIWYKYKLRNDGLGLYHSSYIENDVLHHVVSSQFEPKFAQRLVPCLDDPSYRAKWTVSVKAPIGYNVLSNSLAVKRQVQGRYATTFFEQTKAIPSYLLAIVVHQYSKLEKKTSNGVTYGIYGQNSKLRNCQKDFDFIGKAIEHLSAKFHVVDFPTKKVDIIEVPFLSGYAMENIGLITVNSNVFCNSENNTFRATLIHELTHQWFGNIVTAASWEDLRMTEGITGYYSRKVAEELDEEFNIPFLPLFPVSQQTNKSNFLIDIVNNQHKYDVKIPIIFSMLAELMGQQDFDKAVSVYLEKNQYGWGSVETFLNIVENITMPYIMNIFKPYLTMKGIPVLYVTKRPGYFFVFPDYHESDSKVDDKVNFKNLYVPFWYSLHGNDVVYHEIARIGQPIIINSDARAIIINPNTPTWLHTFYDDELLDAVVDTFDTKRRLAYKNFMYELEFYSNLNSKQKENFFNSF